MNKKFFGALKEDLFNLAEQLKWSKADNRNFIEPLNGNAIAADLGRLGNAYFANYLPLEGSLKLFFTRDALSVLMNLPNEYWFWRMVQGALKGPFNGKVTLKAVRVAFYEIQDRLEDQISGCRDLSSLQQHQLAERIAHGVILIERGFRAKLIVNPIATLFANDRRGKPRLCRRSS